MLQPCGGLPMKGGLVQTRLCRLFVLDHQSPGVGLFVLCLPAIEIAFFLVMIEQILLFPSVCLHFPGKVFIVFRQSQMIARSSGIF